jgi:hypothetical protein
MQVFGRLDPTSRFRRRHFELLDELSDIALICLFKEYYYRIAGSRALAPSLVSRFRVVFDAVWHTVQLIKDLEYPKGRVDSEQETLQGPLPSEIGR